MSDFDLRTCGQCLQMKKLYANGLFRMHLLKNDATITVKHVLKSYQKSASQLLAHSVADGFQKHR